jgi:hypothetical protein
MIDIEVPKIERKSRGLFTGEFVGPVVAVNPNKQEYIELIGLQEVADKIKDPNYTNIRLGSDDFTKIEFYYEIDPNELLPDNQIPAGTTFEKIYQPYTIFISKEYSFNKNKTKVQVIDDGNQLYALDQRQLDLQHNLQSIAELFFLQHKEPNYFAYRHRLLELLSYSC